MENKIRVVPPAYERLTEQYATAFNHHVRTLARQEGVLSAISSHAIHEGRSSTLTRSDGVTVEMDLREMGDDISFT